MAPSFKCQRQRDHNVFGRLWMSFKRWLPCDFNARTCILLDGMGVLMTSQGVINRPRLLANRFCQTSMGFIKFYCCRTQKLMKEWAVIVIKFSLGGIQINFSNISNNRSMIERKICSTHISNTKVPFARISL